MADSLLGKVSGTTTPYKTGSYTVEQNDKNTLSMTGYFQLLAAQLQNQDMSNPMDNSELMAQMTQMAMVQAVTAMNTAMKNSTAVTTQTYAASLVGQEVTMAVVEENSYGQETPVDVKYSTVEWVNFTSGDPTIKLKDDEKEYSLTHLVGMGRVPNPFADKTGESSGTDTDNGGDSEEGGTDPKITSRMASEASYSSRPPVAGYVDDSEEPKRTGNTGRGAAMAAAANLAELSGLSGADMESLRESRKTIKELASSGAFTSPSQIPDLTITR